MAASFNCRFQKWWFKGLYGRQLLLNTWQIQNKRISQGFKLSVQGLVREPKSFYGRGAGTHVGLNIMPTMKEQVAAQICKVDPVTMVGSRARRVIRMLPPTGSLNSPGLYNWIISRADEQMLTWLTPTGEAHPLTQTRRKPFPRSEPLHWREGWFPLRLDPTTFTAMYYQSFSQALLKGACWPFPWVALYLGDRIPRSLGFTKQLICVDTNL